MRARRVCVCVCGSGHAASVGFLGFFFLLAAISSGLIHQRFLQKAYVRSFFHPESSLFLVGCRSSCFWTTNGRGDGRISQRKPHTSIVAELQLVSRDIPTLTFSFQGRLLLAGRSFELADATEV